MASIKERISKDGSKSYLVTVSFMKDGKRQTVSDTYKPESQNWSKKKLDAKIREFAVTFENKVKAGEIQTKQQKKQEQARINAMPTLVKFLTNTFIPRKQRELTKGTILRYKSFATILKNDDLGKMKMADVRPIHINEFLQRLIDNGNCVATVNNRRIQLNVIFEMAVELELIGNNPMSKVKPLKQSKQEKSDKAQEVKSLTVKQVKDFLAIVDTLPLVWQAFFRFLLDTGCRLGEARGLRWSDIDFNSKTVHIQRQLLNDNIESTTKSGKSRKIVLSDRTVSLLKSLMNESHAGVYVFVYPSSREPLAVSSVEYKIKTIGEKIDCPWLHVHSLRHTCATLSLNRGASLNGVSRKLGHATPRITASIYLHGDDEEAAKATEALSDIMN